MIEVITAQKQQRRLLFSQIQTLSTIYIANLIQLQMNYDFQILISSTLFFYYIQQHMRNIQLFGLTPSGSFLFADGNELKQGTFEGLQFRKCVGTREILKSYWNKQMEVKFLKNSNKFRHTKLDFYEQMIKLGAAKINQCELDQSKLFTADEKQKIKQVSAQLKQNENGQIIDYCLDRKQLSRLLNIKKQISAELQFLGQQILISFHEGDRTHYLPVKLRNLDHYFQLIDKGGFNRLLRNRTALAVRLVSCKFNLAKKRHEVEAVFPPELERQMLAEGWATVALKNIHLIPPELFSEYRRLEQQAKVAHKGIFAKPFQILSLVYTKNNLVAVVEEIIEGYIYRVRSKGDEPIKIELAKIYCPIANEAGAFACREFARKNLIGREVNVFLTKDEGLNMQGSLVRLADNKDVESLMIESGFGFVKEELKGTMFYGKIETLEKKAKDLRKGVHNDKGIGYQYYQDLTVAHNKKEKLDKRNFIEAKQQYLRHSQPGDEAIIEKYVDPITYIVRVDAHKKLLRVRLDGVARLQANPRLPEVIELQKANEQFYARSLHQRTVALELLEYSDASNSFVGVVRHTAKGKERLSLQECLLANGLVVLTKHGFFQEKWVECQRQAQEKKVGCWSQKLRNFAGRDLLEEQDREFSGKVSWCEDGETVYVQPTSVAQQLDHVAEVLVRKEELKFVSLEDLVPGYVCAAEYQSELYRTRLVSVSDKNAVVKFIDWGNKETVLASQLRHIPDDLQYIPPLCCEVILDLVKRLKTRDVDHLQKIRQFLSESEYTFKKSYANVVNIYKGPAHINSVLIQEGLTKADLAKIADEDKRQQMREEMNRLRKQLVGVWELEEDSDHSDYQY